MTTKYAKVADLMLDIAKEESNPFLDQIDFMISGNQNITEFNKEQCDLYINLIDEETDEFFGAIIDHPYSVEAIKEAVDILVVTIGYLVSRGVNPQLAWNIVHENNMFKVSQEVVKDENGKIQKSPESIEKKKEMMEKLRGLLDG